MAVESKAKGGVKGSCIGFWKMFWFEPLMIATVMKRTRDILIALIAFVAFSGCDLRESKIPVYLEEPTNAPSLVGPNIPTNNWVRERRLTPAEKADYSADIRELRLAEAKKGNGERIERITLSKHSFAWVTGGPWK